MHNHKMQEFYARPDWHLQKGVATLPISLILLILLTLMTLYAARVGLLGTRTAANKVRYDEAFQAAESGIEQGMAYINRNRELVNGGWVWTQCDAGDTALPCGEIPSSQRANWLYIQSVPNMTAPSSGSFALHFLTPCRDLDGTAGCDSPVQPYRYAPIAMFAQGTSADQSGAALVRQTMTFFKVGGGADGAPVPIMSPGNIPLNGNYTVVPNPNGGGRGVALSVWTAANVDLSTGSVVTCHVEEFLASKSGSQFHDTTTNPGIDMCDSCVCDPGTTGSLSQSTPMVKNYDILDNDPNFPDDVFQYLTGTPAESYPAFREYVASIPDGQVHYHTDCSDLDENSSGWHWVDGNCNPDGSVGSYAHPVVLIVNGDATFNGNTYLFGILFVFTPPGGPQRDLKTNGNVTIYGSLMSNEDIDMPNGGFVMRYAGEVIGNIFNDPGTDGFGKLPNSWADF